MRTTRYNPHKTYHLQIKAICGLVALFYLSASEFEDAMLTGEFIQTFYGNAARSYHVLFRPVDYDLMEVWKLIGDHDAFQNKPH